MAVTEIATLDHLANLLATDARFAPFVVTATGDDWIELRVGEGGVTLAAARLLADPAALHPHLVRSASGSTMLLLLGRDDEFRGAEELRERAEFAVVTLPLSPARLYITLKNYLDLVALRARAIEHGRTAARFEYELGELVSIARALSSERDIHKLLGLILRKSREVTGADAGSVYVVEGRALDPRQRSLRFMVSQNDSVPVDLSEYSLPVDERSIVGRAVTAREVINIPDLYRLEEPGANPWGFHHDRQVDRRTGYHGRSMLTVPMVNQNDEVIGVIQLINRRREGAPLRLGSAEDFERWVVPFDRRAEDLAATLAAQAGISLENTLLYQDIRRLFDGFVNASVTAIEARDPTTSGHSQRVATLTLGLAELVNREAAGAYRSLHFSADALKEIEYAALLHDFGKVGVRERVLVKAKKLYDDERAAVLQRFDYVRLWLESEALREKLSAPAASHAGIDDAAATLTAELDEFAAFVLHANEPTVFAAGGFERLGEIAARRYRDARGRWQPYLTPAEVDALGLPRGSLTSDERREIESHVVHTFNFLETIPWGRHFNAIPAIAGAHHEKLDGSGYPRGLAAADIRVETRMLTIADIFDALTAKDRPYKRAVPVDKALAILDDEVRAGKCDAELLRIFVGGEVWRRVIA